MTRAISKGAAWNDKDYGKSPVGRRRRTMKKAATLVALVMVIALGSIAAQAQAMLKANIPFDFTVGKTHLASGTYYVSQAGSEVEIWYNDNGKASTMFLTIPMSNLKADLSRNVLEFKHYGDEYILAEVWTGQRGHGVRANLEKIRLAEASSSKPTLIAMQVVK